MPVVIIVILLIVILLITTNIRIVPQASAYVIERLGGYTNAYTSLEHTVFTVNVLPENWKIGLNENQYSIKLITKNKRKNI